MGEFTENIGLWKPAVDDTVDVTQDIADNMALLDQHVADLEASVPVIRIAASFVGTLTVTTGLVRFYLDRNCTLGDFRGSVGTAPTGAAVRFDVFKNGAASIFASAPSIAISGFTVVATPTVAAAACVAGDYLTFRITQVGSSVAGTDLSIQGTAV